MADPMRIRAQAKAGNAIVSVLINHPMEYGKRKDSAGKLIPVRYIQEVTASHNGRLVLTSEWGGAVSKNPVLQFTLKGANPGDRINVSWRDNLGDTRTDEGIVS